VGQQRNSGVGVCILGMCCQMCLLSWCHHSGTAASVSVCLHSRSETLILAWALSVTDTVSVSQS
jgi:hypothetical protein